MGKGKDYMKNKTNALLRFTFCLVLLFIAYVPTLKWMLDRWNAHESYYGHGFLIPLVSLYILWQRRELLKKAKFSSEFFGLAIIVGGLLMHIVCAALKIYFISGFSFVAVLYGLILFCFGKGVARCLVFPVFFLLAMIPLPLVVVGNLTVKLKLFVAQVSTFTLNIIGFPSILDGSTIRMPTSFIIVAAPCSGLRSLISLITLGLLFAFAIRTSYLKKGLLFLSAIPIAIISNLLRIVILAMVNDLYGEEVAQGFFHDFSGFLLFGVAFIGLLSVSRVLEGHKADE